MSSTITTWSSPNGIGDPANNWTYLVMAVNTAEQELARSNRVGEQDFEAEIRQDVNGRRGESPGR